jgi:hypothetical protein
MSADSVQDTVQENQETQVENKQETPSDPGLLQEVMQKKEKIKTLEAIIAKRDAESEKGRQKKLEEDGKYKELIAENSSTIDKLNAKIESQSGIVDNYKKNLVNGLTSDDERKEYLSTKSVDFLEELTKEKASLEPPITNPKESLGAVRQPVQNLEKVWNMNDQEKRENWGSIVKSYIDKRKQ